MCIVCVGFLLVPRVTAPTDLVVTVTQLYFAKVHNFGCVLFVFPAELFIYTSLSPLCGFLFV